VLTNVAKDHKEDVMTGLTKVKVYGVVALCLASFLFQIAGANRLCNY
jgi:hypothetical protein